MRSDFSEVNEYVYHSSCGAVYDVVIWCLGPYVDAEPSYGRLRIWLAQVTRWLARRWYRIAD